MGITVIEQTTAERRQETINLFNQIKPLLDDGYGYMSACVKIGKVPDNGRQKSGYYMHGWFKDLKAYGESQGYDYATYSGKGLK